MFSSNIQTSENIFFWGVIWWCPAGRYERLGFDKGVVGWFKHLNMLGDKPWDRVPWGTTFAQQWTFPEAAMLRYFLRGWLMCQGCWMNMMLYGCIGLHVFMHRMFYLLRSAIMWIQHGWSLPMLRNISDLTFYPVTPQNHHFHGCYGPSPTGGYGIGLPTFNEHCHLVRWFAELKHWWTLGFSIAISVYQRLFMPL